MKPTTLFYVIFLLFSFFSCNLREEKVATFSKQKETVDTLYLPEGLYRDTVTNESSFIKDMTYQAKTVNGLPKNDTILYSVRAKGKLKYVLDNCNVFMKPADKGFDIQKIDNQHFKIFIHPDYELETIRMDVYIAPKKGFVVKTYFSEEIIPHGEYTGFVQFAEVVEHGTK